MGVHAAVVMAMVMALVCVATQPIRAEQTPTTTEPAEAAYQRARTCYYDLKEDLERQKQRGPWEACIREFLTVTRDFPTSEREADAAFTVAKLYEELYTASHNVEDLRIAIDHYDQFAVRHRRHRLADDALFRVGRIRWDGFQDKRKAKAAMWRVIRWYPESDMTIEAKKFIREVDQLKESRRPAGALLEIKPTPVKLPPIASRQSPVTAVTSDAVLAPSPQPPISALHIVIDPGHGGTDVGAIGPAGTYEKQVTLAISRRLARALREQLGCQVTLTRDKDVYLSLDQRNAIANRRKADLFLSIHANAAESKEQRGVQTYYLNNASDEAAKRLADRENKVAGKSLPAIEQIVATMMQNALTDESQVLARAVHTQVVGRLGKRYPKVRDQGVRTALFYVLVGAKSPSILVETSYLSHPEEERRLNDPTYQTTIVQAISQGVQQYLRDRRAVVNL